MSFAYWEFVASLSTFAAALWNYVAATAAAALEHLAGWVLVLLVGFFGGRLKTLVRRRTFRRVFGRGVATSNDVVLSVPLWLALETQRESFRFRKPRAGREDQLFYGPDQMYNRQDMLAAAHVLNVINSHLDHEVNYLNDSETPDWDKTVVLIGSPLANFHAANYLASHAEARPNDVFACFHEITETTESGSRLIIRDPLSNTSYSREGSFDYGLVLRLPNVRSQRSRHFVFLVAGISEWSTREAGRLFNLHWRSLANEGLFRALWRILRPWTWNDFPRPVGFIFKMSPGEKGIGTGVRL